MKKILIIFLVLSLASCSAFGKKTKPKAEYTVSVEANGKKISGETEKLVSRVMITRNQIKSIFGTPSKPKIPPEFGDKSANGKKSKIFVSKETKFTKALNLKYGDVITSIDENVVDRKQDLNRFATLFSTQQEVGFDFQRGNKVMKTILYVGSNR